jgi:hypothetical protein
MSSNTIIDPRQLKTLELYKNPSSETFGNLKQSAIRAGYSYDYSDQLSAIRPQWLSDNTVEDVRTIQKAEKNLRKINDKDINLDKDTKYNADLIKTQVDVSKFLLKTQARAKYSDEIEQTPPNVQVNIINYGDKDKIIDAEVITNTLK